MSKIVKKFPIDDLWNIGRSESWFSDKAAEGLHLNSFSRLFVKFEKKEPANTKYRIDILYKTPSNEQLNVYKECGWDFVANNGMFYVFSSPEDSNAPELHTDLTEQSFTLDNLNKILKRNIIVFTISLLLMIGLVLGIYLFSDEPYLFFINGGSFIVPIIFSFSYLFSLFITLRNYIYVKRIKVSLINGIPINHQENWKKNSLASKVLNIITILVAIIGIIISVTQMIKRDEYTLPDTKNNLPIIRLADIENNPNLQRESKFYDEDVDFYNNVQYEWNVLASIHYDVVEKVIINNEMWEDNSGVYSPSVSTDYYKLQFENMSKGLVNDLISRHIYLPLEPLVKVENTNFNQLYYSIKSHSKEIFASWDDNVIYIRYHGNADINHLIELLSKLANNTNLY